MDFGTVLSGMIASVQKKVITFSGEYLGLTNFAIINYDKMQPVGKSDETKKVKKGK